MLGDPTGLRQLVLNLLLNACQIQQGRQVQPARPGREEHRTGDPDAAGRRRDPRAELVDVRTERRGDRAVLVVEDRGPGFSAEARDHLFEPFFSTRGSTGLGLSVVHGIVVEHGGTIHAENRPDGGARVIVEIPIARPEGDDA